MFLEIFLVGVVLTLFCYLGLRETKLMRLPIADRHTTQSREQPTLSPSRSENLAKNVFPTSCVSPSASLNRAERLNGTQPSLMPLTFRDTSGIRLGDGQVAVISAKHHKRQRRKRQSVTAKREKSQTPKVLTAILTLPNLP